MFSGALNFLDPLGRVSLPTLLLEEEVTTLEERDCKVEEAGLEELRAKEEVGNSWDEGMASLLKDDDISACIEEIDASDCEVSLIPMELLMGP